MFVNLFFLKASPEKKIFKNYFNIKFICFSHFIFIHSLTNKMEEPFTKNDVNRCSKCNKVIDKQKEPVKCIRECLDVIYCSTECRRKHRSVHQNVCILPEKKKTEGTKTETDKMIETMEKIGGLSDLCTGCQKLKSILRCCKQAEYCSNTCANIDWERHKPDCENPLFYDDAEISRIKLFISLIMRHWTNIIKIYTDHMNKNGYGLVIMMRVLLQNEENLDLEHNLEISAEQAFDCSFQLLHPENLKRIYKKLDKIKIPVGQRPLQVFLVSLMGEEVRTFRIELDRCIIANFYHGGQITFEKLKTLLSTIEAADIAKDPLVMEILYSKNSLEAWKLVDLDDIDRTGVSKKEDVVTHEVNNNNK